MKPRLFLWAAAAVAAISAGVWIYQSQPAQPATDAPSSTSPSSRKAPPKPTDAPPARELTAAPVRPSPPRQPPPATPTLSAPSVRSVSELPPEERATAPSLATATPPPAPPPAATDAKVADPGGNVAGAELDAVRYMLRDYRAINGENPVGTNAEIMKALMGGAKKGAMLGPPAGQELNGQGELVDRWGTPYFFHQLSAQEMEVRSAGPDHVMWTDDDEVTR